MDLSRADFALLSSLNALLKTRGVTSAAHLMNVSQPAMSAQLARLRDIFDDPLLVGNAHGMSLTPTAEQIAPRLAAGIGDLTQLVREGVPFDPAKHVRTFQIASTDYIAAASLIPAIHQMHSHKPNISIALVGLDGPKASLEDVDLIVATPSLVTNDAEQTDLYTEKFVLVMHKDHPAVRRKLNLDTFCDLDHVLVSPSRPGFEGPIDQILSKHGKSRNVQISLPTFLLALHAVRESQLVAVLPKRLVDSYTDEVAVFDLPFDSPDFQVIATWHPRMDKDRGHTWFRKQIIDRVRRAQITKSI